VIGNDPQDQAYGSALLKNVGAKSAETIDAIGNVYFGILFQLLLLAVRHDRKGHVEGIVRRQPRRIRDGMQLAADPHHRK
jgi:hypothetical protein